MQLSAVEFVCSLKTSPQCETLIDQGLVRRCSIKGEHERLLKDYTLLMSLHCRQVFPPSLVKAIRCINFHPGFNPHNRGWYPHVFSMINGLPAGITIHEMDEQIDHGPIIHQEQVTIEPHDVSSDVYARIIQREKVLFQEWVKRLIEGHYTTRLPESEGNYHSKADFEQLKGIQLEQTATAREFINYLRAMSFEGYRNASFVDPTSQKRYYVTVRLEPETS